MLELSTASAAQTYFNGIVEKVAGIKIRSISSANPCFNSNVGYRKYEDCDPIYIVFENGQCLIIDYPFVDELRADFRPLTDKEKAIQIGRASCRERV